MELLIEAAGWAGALLILGSYILVSAGKLTGQSAAYQWMNIVGAAGFVVNSGWHGAIPSTALNVVWLAVGLFTLWRLSRGRA
jgi:formate hydrogenlyase subunit 3/multisubunit Na+/H+ antiporter MnhD subunit